jgi:methyl-accepting chemotaxis protein
MGNIITSINSLNSNIEEQADSVSRSTSAIEQMAAHIAEIARNLEDNAQNMETLKVAEEKGHEALRKVSTDIQEVVKESERLLEIAKVIQSIASQTNLLSMNAAIEAAHAGDVGKGFAVVADEVRKLAESSSEQAKTVSAVLVKIKKSLDGISGSTASTQEHFEHIAGGIQTVSAEEERIKNAMEDQRRGSSEVLEIIEKSNSITRNVKESSGVMLSGSQEVVGEAKNLEALTLDLTSATSDIANGMDQVNAAVLRVYDISRTNREHIVALLAEIDRFTV